MLNKGLAMIVFGFEGVKQIHQINISAVPDFVVYGPEHVPRGLLRMIFFDVLAPSSPQLFAQARIGDQNTQILF